MKGRKICFMEKYGKLSLNNPCYPFFSVALTPNPIVKNIKALTRPKMIIMISWMPKTLIPNYFDASDHVQSQCIALMQKKINKWP